MTGQHDIPVGVVCDLSPISPQEVTNLLQICLKDFSDPMEMYQEVKAI